jgi:hypothetical protein
VPDYHYSYLIGTLLFVAAWMVCLIAGKRFQPQSAWGALVSAPFAITSILFIPQYWTPPSLFDLDARYKVGIEDFLWAGAVGGIASVIGEILLEERLAKKRREQRKKHILPFMVLAVLLVGLQLWRPEKTIYNMIIALTICAAVVVLRRPDLLVLMVVGAATFTVLYWALFEILLRLYPGFIEKFYNVPNLLGYYVLGVPVEELLFAASGGAVWSVAYEYLQGYRLRTSGGIRFEHV